MLVALVVLALFLLVAPVALIVAARSGLDWSLLSDVGQAYGGAATIIGMVAIVGVGISLTIQVRDSALSREMAQRTLLNELIFKAIDDPSLQACWGPIHGDQGEDRQHLYVNTIVSFWRSMFDLGKLSEIELRIHATRMFAGPSGRTYWSLAADERARFESGSRGRTFNQILNEEYRLALARVLDNTAEA